MSEGLFAFVAPIFGALAMFVTLLYVAHYNGGWRQILIVLIFPVSGLIGYLFASVVLVRYYEHLETVGQIGVGVFSILGCLAVLGVLSAIGSFWQVINFPESLD